MMTRSKLLPPAVNAGSSRDTVHATSRGLEVMASPWRASVRALQCMARCSYSFSGGVAPVPRDSGKISGNLRRPRRCGC